MFNTKHSITFKNDIYLYIIILSNIMQYLRIIQCKYRVRCKYNSDFAIIIKLYYNSILTKFWENVTCVCKNKI